MMMFTAMPVTRASQQWSLVLPNPWNMAFSYYYYIIFNVILYIPGISKPIKCCPYYTLLYSISTTLWSHDSAAKEDFE